MTFALYIKLAGQIRPFLPNVKISFITSHVEHAIGAFKQSALWLVHGLLAGLAVWFAGDLQAPRPEPGPPPSGQATRRRTDPSRSIS